MTGLSLHRPFDGAVAVPVAIAPMDTIAFAMRGFDVPTSAWLTERGEFFVRVVRADGQFAEHLGRSPEVAAHSLARLLAQDPPKRSN